MSTIRKKSPDPFTPDERAILSAWFAGMPAACRCARSVAARIRRGRAIRECGQVTLTPIGSSSVPDVLIT
jgi:hypothetical protein